MTLELSQIDKGFLLMGWELTYLFVHICALYGAVILFRGTPDHIQRVVMGVLICSMLVYIGADIVVLSGEKRAWVVRLIASRFEHTAVLLWLFRLVWIGTGTCRSIKSLR